MDFNINSITGIPYSTADYMNSVGTNPLTFIVLIVVIILYYILFASLGGNENVQNISSNNGKAFFEVLLWSIFILLILLNGMSYFFNVNIVAKLKNIFTKEPEIDIIVDRDLDDGDVQPEIIEEPIPEITTEPQVFHVPDNKYTYDNAKAICKAYGGNLANYEQMKDAHDNGADWCSYGWSDNQMAFFPTQINKWKKLQNIKGHEHDCGRPGINGGYIANPNVRFGVNCFGYKPKITNLEAQKMSDAQTYPKTQKEIDFDKRVDHWKNKLPELLVAPFNKKEWSMV